MSSISAPSIPHAAEARDEPPSARQAGDWLRLPSLLDRRAAVAVNGRRVLVIALLLSFALHLAGGSGAIDWLSSLYDETAPEPSPPLRTVLRPPPPPVFAEVPRPPPLKAGPRPKPKKRPAPPVITAPAEAASAPVVADATSPTPEPSAATKAATEAAPPKPEPAPPAPVEAIAEEPVPPAPAIPIPRRIDLVGSVSVGATDFLIGTGGFSLRHDGNRYQISVLGRAQGLARLLLLGEFGGVSRGAITPEGLQPSEYIEERGRPDRRETAILDWEAGVIRLQDDKVEPIEPPVYDRLSVIMQFYFKPPAGRVLSMRVAGTRYVDTYTFRRRDDEAIELPIGIVTAEVWRADYDDGNPRIELWMSPEYHYLPLRVRIHTRRENGGRFATLSINEIKVED